MQYKKQQLGLVEFKKQEIYINMQAGLFAGIVAAAATNALEAITVAKQTNPEVNLNKMIRKEGVSLLTKGLGPRVA